MTRLISSGTVRALSGVFAIACCAVVAQNQNSGQKLDPSVLANAPAVPQMLVDSDGTLHFGPRTVPPPALQSQDFDPRQ